MFTASMRFDCGEDVEALREMVHRWAQDRVAPMAAGHRPRQRNFPMTSVTEMGELGLLGITVPEEDGGAGMGYLAHTVAVEEIARASVPPSRSATGRIPICASTRSPQRLAGAEGEIPAGPDLGQGRGQSRHVRGWVRVRRRLDEAPRRKAQ